MIQRIQTIFLFLAIIALVAFNFLPYWQSSTGSAGSNLLLMSYGLVDAGADVFVMELSLYTIVAGISGIAMIIMLIEVFMYKDRIAQMKLAIGNSFLMSINLVLMAYFIIGLQEEHVGGFGVGTFIYALAMLLNILARRFIQKDEKLVRSVDRLR